MEVLDQQIETEFTLGKRQLNLLADTMAGLPAVHTVETRPLSRQDIVQGLSGYNYSDTFVTSGQTNLTRPAVIGGLVGRQARKSGYIAGIDAEDVGRIVDVATDASNHSKTPIVLRMVYGATERASLRALSYPLPAIQAISNIRQESGAEAFLQVVFANNISGGLNGLDAARVQDQTSRIVFGVSAIARMAGSEDYVGFYHDEEVGFDGIGRIAGALKATAPDGFVEIFKDKGLNGDYEATCRYVAAHHVIHDNPDTALSRFEGVELPAKARVIDIGGIQEKYFRAARKVIGHSLDIPIETAQLYTRHFVPPYYMARGGDLSLDEFMDGTMPNSNIAPAAHADLSYLQSHVDINALRGEVANV